MGWRAVVVCLLVVAQIQYAHSYVTYSFNMSEDMAWMATRRENPTTGDYNRAINDGLHHMFQASCGSTLYISWTAFLRNNTAQWWRGHLAQFTVSSTGVPTFVRDITYNYCYEMGGLAVLPDCSRVSVICRVKAANRTLLPSNVPIVDVATPFSATIGNMGVLGSADYIYVLEFTTLPISTLPNRIYWLTSAAFGLNTGFADLSMNDTVYAATMVTTIAHTAEVYVRFYRPTTTVTNGSVASILDADHDAVPHGGASRLIYNPELKQWLRMVRSLDSWVNTVTDRVGNANNRLVVQFNQTVAYGGLTLGASRGTKGYFYMAVLRRPSLPYRSIGILPLPANVSGMAPELDGNASRVAVSSFSPRFIWLDKYLSGTTNVSYFGMPNIQKIMFNNTLYYLVGWADLRIDRDNAPKAFNLLLIDSDGVVRTASTFKLGDDAGWTDETNWEYLPASGCVSMVGNWNVNSTEDLTRPKNNAFPTTHFSNRLRMTVICVKQVNGVFVFGSSDTAQGEFADVSSSGMAVGISAIAAGVALFGAVVLAAVIVRRRVAKVPDAGMQLLDAQ